MNPYSSYREIPLTQGQTAFIDESDFNLISAYKWCARWDKCTSGFYAMRVEVTNRKFKSIYMARLIMGLERGDKRTVDHINHNTLDNRRQNLRVCTKAQNCMNRGTWSKTGFKGVSRVSDNCFMAEIKANGERVYLGCRRTPELASELYKEAAIRLHGSFACLS